MRCQKNQAVNPTFPNHKACFPFRSTLQRELTAHLNWPHMPAKTAVRKSCKYLPGESPAFNAFSQQSKCVAIRGELGYRAMRARECILNRLPHLNWIKRLRRASPPTSPVTNVRPSRPSNFHRFQWGPRCSLDKFIRTRGTYPTLASFRT